MMQPTLADRARAPGYSCRQCDVAAQTVERMDLNVARWQQDPRVKLRQIGTSLDGRDINLLQIGVHSPSRTDERLPCDGGEHVAPLHLNVELGSAVTWLRFCAGSIAASKRNIWIVSGQHPGEDQHSAFTEVRAKLAAT